MGFGKKRSNKVGVGAITTSKRKLFAEGGMMDDGKNVDPVSGNDVPVGSLAEEVRDDVDAKLSPGEFVFPADVVRFIGLERLMQMRDQAKKGLMRMNDIGQMGNAEDAGEKADDTYEEDDNFDDNIDKIIKEVDKEEIDRQTEQAFNVGGFVNQSYYDLTKAPKNPALDIRYFKDSAGKDFYMPFINGKPMKPMPNGVTQISGPPSKTIDDEKEEGGGDAGGAAAGAGVAGVIADTRDLTGTLTPNIPGAVDTSGPATQQQQISDSENAGASAGISGVYTGDNLADFGRVDPLTGATDIYNPGGSGPAGEITTADLHQGIKGADLKTITTVASAVAFAMGIPGIVTLPARLAANKFGADIYNEWVAKTNQELAGKSAGIDTSTEMGKLGAGMVMDVMPSPTDTRPAASAGATGTGSIAGQASRQVAIILKNSGLSDDEIGAFSQRAADAVVRGIDLNTAINNAKTAAVDAIYANKILLGENVTREQIANSLFNISGGSLEDFGDLEGGTMGGGLGDADEFTRDFYETNELNVGDFWGTMDEEETRDSGFFNSAPPGIVKNPFAKKFTQQG